MGEQYQSRLTLLDFLHFTLTLQNKEYVYTAFMCLIEDTGYTVTSHRYSAY